jgi:hypothetical protein
MMIMSEVKSLYHFVIITVLILVSHEYNKLMFFVNYITLFCCFQKISSIWYVSPIQCKLILGTLARIV